MLDGRIARRRAPRSARAAAWQEDRMEKIRKSITIESAPSKVFDYLTEPAHYLEVWPSMVEVSNPKTSPDGALSFDWTYKMAGMRFHGRSETVEVERPRFRKVRNASGIPSTIPAPRPRGVNGRLGVPRIG